MGGQVPLGHHSWTRAPVVIFALPLRNTARESSAVFSGEGQTDGTLRFCMHFIQRLALSSFAAAFVRTLAIASPTASTDAALMAELAQADGRTIDANSNLIPAPLDRTTVARKTGARTISVPAGMRLVPADEGADTPDFFAGIYEVTQAEYSAFLAKNPAIAVPRGWASRSCPSGKENFPVTGIAQPDALAYCAWVAAQTGRSVNLPTDKQAERLTLGASRGPHADSHIRTVGSDRRDVNCWGCCDVIGNALELTVDAVAAAPNDHLGFRLVMDASSADAAPEFSKASSAAEVLQPYYGAYFTKHPQSQAVDAGARVTLTAQASALVESQSIRYQWYFNGVPIPGATSESYTIANVQLADVGVYHAEASLPRPTPSALRGSEPSTEPSATASPLSVSPLPSLSNPAVIAIGTTGTPPSVTRQPASVSVLRGDTALVTASFVGTPPLATRWKVRQTDLLGITFSPTDFADFQFTSDESSSTVSYRNPPLGTVTQLELTVFGAFGTATATTVEIRVLAEGAAPVITAQPRSLTVARGSNIVFQVSATGAPAPSFQWFRNGTLLAGANTDTLPLSNIQDSETGSYTVTATNSLGVVTSAPATLSLSATSSAGGGGSGGGGAPSLGFIMLMLTFAWLRTARGNRAS